MVPVSEYLNLVTLIVNANLINNLANYQPTYVESSRYYYKSDDLKESQPRPVNFDPIFSQSIFFPKCCPPGFIYNVNKKDCKASSNVSPIYDDFKLKVNLIKSGLSECDVVVDRFMKSKDLMRAGTKELKINLKISKDRFTPGAYCMDKTVQSDVFVIKICGERSHCSDISRNRTKEWCVNKCCWDGYSYLGHRCEFNENHVLPDDKYRKYYESEDSYGFLYGITNCIKQRIHRVANLDFYISRKGSLVRKDNAAVYEIGQYCLDSASFVDSGERHDIVLLCDNKKGVNIRLAITLIVVVIIFAGFVTVFLKSFLIYELEGLIVKLVACYAYVEALFWILVMLKITFKQFDHFCFVFGCLDVLMSISRLAWLNVVEYEIWLTVGSNGVCTSKSKTSMWVQFLYYTLYAITIPGVTMVNFMLAHHRIYPLVITPQLNIFTCIIQLGE
ncbi:hypothetical protein AMK59_4930 [Oryctes borbonicus]|uniref:G-protein coupled receptors family 2 profile 2 domain-containing protein n=1 Tax=Oryctes borbonicus TaxID=1629725 RepID=A0A0T6B023_9SCAR|nr:hypothetical protein AMK59_4930 [Oryctes borbonicus]